MKQFNTSSQFPRELTPTAVALGTFDGVHQGHQELLRRTREAAAKIRGSSVLYTFEPHPVRVLAPEECPPLLTTLEQKLSLVAGAGIDAAVVEPFTPEFARQDAETFFRAILLERLRAQAVIVGYDFTFGLHRQGTIERLEAFGRAHGIETLVVPAVFAGETLVSSTIIRRMIGRGQVDHAAELLGRPYAIEGRVVPGRGFGRELAARTANIEAANEVVPASGVYVTRTIVRGIESGEKNETRESGGTRTTYPSVTSIGDNPTFPDSPFAIETHLIDAEVELIGETIAIEFLAFLRGQIRFEGTEALRAQIARDIETARQYHERCHRERTA